MTLRIALVLASTRPGRRGDQIATWLVDTARAHGDADYELIDLADPVAETLAALRRKGFGRLFIEGAAVTLEDVHPGSLRDRTTLQVIVDRLKVEGDLRARLTDSIETAYTEGGGAAFAIEADNGRVHRFSERFDTNGLSLARAWKNGALSSRAAASSMPIVTSTPASRSRCTPPRATGCGSSQATTTRLTPAASSASVHGGVLPW